MVLDYQRSKFVDNETTQANKVNNLKKMMCAYAIGKEDLSFKKQPALTELVRLCGSGMDHHYCDRESARELVKCISSVIRADQLKAISKLHLCSVLRSKFL